MRSSCSTTGASWLTATTRQLLEASELYREIVERGLPEQVFLTTETREREVSGI